jgi:hypothetical protein
MEEHTQCAKITVFIVGNCLFFLTYVPLRMTELSNQQSHQEVRLSRQFVFNFFLSTSCFERVTLQSSVFSALGIITAFPENNDSPIFLT